MPDAVVELVSDHDCRAPKQRKTVCPLSRDGSFYTVSSRVARSPSRSSAQENEPWSSANQFL
jgi:hypothetical protein